MHARMHTYMHARRFWFRWSVVRQSERLGLSPPLFRPPMIAWDAWLSSHNRTKRLEAHVPRLHWGFRVRHCFQFWHFFTARNKVGTCGCSRCPAADAGGKCSGGGTGGKGHGCDGWTPRPSGEPLCVCVCVA